MNKLTPEEFREFDQLYVEMFNAVSKFYRFYQDHNHDLPPREREYYERASETLRRRIDHEMKHLGRMSSSSIIL